MKKGYKHLNPLFPHSDADLAILKKRAEKLALQEKHIDSDGELFIKFQLGGKDTYGIPYRFMDEIVLTMGLTPIPQTPTFIAGVIHRRGELLTVLNLMPIFGSPAQEINHANRILVVRTKTVHVGLLVGSVVGNERYLAKNLVPFLKSTDKIGNNFIEGIHDGNSAILDLDRLLSDASFCVGKKK